MANLFQILNQFVTLFVKNSNGKNVSFNKALLCVKINARISDTPCILYLKDEARYHFFQCIIA
jgi:hypothetical protein